MAIQPTAEKGILNLQGKSYEAITKSDETVYEESNGLFVGTAGNVAFKNAQGATAVFKNIANGTFLPITYVQVLETGTTASDLIRIW